LNSTQPILIPEKGKKKMGPSRVHVEPSHWWAENYMTETRLSPFLACANIPSEDEERRRKKKLG
jgi:hypothetical protein